MKHQTRLQILEEIATKVAEMNIIGNGHLSDEIIAKAFLLQTEKKRNQITQQAKPAEPKEITEARARVRRKPAATNE